MADKKSSDAAKAAMAAMGAVGQYDPAALLSLYSMTAAYGGIGGMTAAGAYTAASPGLFINTLCCLVTILPHTNGLRSNFSSVRPAQSFLNSTLCLLAKLLT